MKWLQSILNFSRSKIKGLTFSQKKKFVVFLKAIGIIGLPHVILHEFSHVIFLFLGNIEICDFHIQTYRYGGYKASVTFDKRSLNTSWRYIFAILTNLSPLLALYAFFYVHYLLHSWIFGIYILFNLPSLFPSQSDIKVFFILIRQYRLFLRLRKK